MRGLFEGALYTLVFEDAVKSNKCGRPELYSIYKVNTIFYLGLNSKSK